MQTKHFFLLAALYWGLSPLPATGDWLVDGLGRPVDSQSSPIPPIFIRLADAIQESMGLNRNDAVAIVNVIIDIDRFQSLREGPLVGNDPHLINEPYIVDLLDKHTILNRSQAKRVVLLLKQKDLNERLGI